MSLSASVRVRRSNVFAFGLFLLSLAGVKDDASRVLAAAEPVGHTRIARAKLRPTFEPNVGQANRAVKFLSRGPGYTLFLTEVEAVVALRRSGRRREELERSNEGLGVRSEGSEEQARQLSVIRGQLQKRKGGARGTSPVTAHSSLQFPGPSAQPVAPSVLRLKLLRANAAAKVTGVNQLPAKTNYFIGNDHKKWHTNVPTYAGVRYESVYPGVNLEYYGNRGGELEYDFVVAPQADPSLIALAVDAEGQVSSSQKAVGRGGLSAANGSGRAGSPATDQAPRATDGNQSQIRNRESKISSFLRIVANGDLIVTTTGGDVRFDKPLVYQLQPNRLGGNSSQSATERAAALDYTSPDNGPWAAASLRSETQGRKLIDGRYTLKADGKIAFEIAPYDRTLPLIIDPVLSYSTYLGGSDMDYANGIAVDPSGNAYVTGYTASADFPLGNPAQSSPGGGTCSDGVDTIPCFDAFVAKLNRTGTALVYSTYLGGSGGDYGTGIALDGSGDAYVTGYTNSTDFPVEHALQSKNAGGYDAFVAELSADGASLLYSTYWGGSGDDIGTGIAVDSSGNAYISGYSASPDFPLTAGALQANYRGGDHDAFVLKVSPAGTGLGYSTFLGGSADDYAYGIAVDSAGDAYVTGATNSTDFPTLSAFQPSYAGGLCGVPGKPFPCYNAFVAKLNRAGLALIFSTFLGGSGSDYGYAIALDASSNAYVTGYTASKDFPTTAGAFQGVFGGSYDAFVTKLDSAGFTLVYSTYLGGTGTEVGYDLAVDSFGRAFVTGYNYGGDFPTVGPTQARNAGFHDAFVSVLNATGSSLAFSTYLGGSYDEAGRGISVDPSGNAYVAGGTFSADFPTTSGSYQPSHGGGPYGAFVTKFILPALPFVALSPSSYDFGNQVVGTTSSARAITLTNEGDAALTISSIAASGDFSQTNNCGSSLAAGASCTLSVTFTPTVTGSRSGSLTITEDATPPTQTVSLTGTSSAGQSPTVSNTGVATLINAGIATLSDPGGSPVVGARKKDTTSPKATASGNIEYVSQFVTGSADCGIAEAYAAAPPTGAYIVFDVGSCTISSGQAVSMTSGKPLFIEGAGSVINMSHASGAGLTLNGTVPQVAWGMSNLTIVYTGSSAGVYGLSLYHMGSGLVNNLSFRGFTTANSYALYMYYCEENLFNSLYIQGQGGSQLGNGIYLDYATNANTFTNYNFSVGQTALYDAGGSADYFKGATIQGAFAKHPIVIDCSAGPLSDIRFDNLYTETDGDGSPGAAQIYINLSTNYLWSFTIRDSNIQVPSGYAIQFAGSGRLYNFLSEGNGYYAPNAAGLCTGAACASSGTVSLNDVVSGSYPISQLAAAWINGGGMGPDPGVKTASTQVKNLPAASSNVGAIWTVTDSTRIATEGQTCVGGGSYKALAFSTGSGWKCF